MSYIKKVICIVIILSVLCALFWGCNNKENNNRKEKPDLHEVMLAYQAKDQKKSLFEAEFKLTFFQKEGQEIVPQSIAQKLTLDRIQNQDKIYIDATLGTSFVSEGFMGYLSAVVSVLSVLSEEEMSLDTEFMRYLRGETHFRGILGYDGNNSYNAKGDYVEKGQTPDYKDSMGNPYWVSIDEVSILNLMYNLGISGDFSPKDFLMFSTMIDLSPSAEWVRRDDADKFFSDEEEAFMYAITTYGAKLRELILQIAGETEDRMDPDEYQEELERYAQIFPTVMSWISVPDSKVDAKVSKDEDLKQLSSSIRVDLNINVKELTNILSMLIEDIPEINISPVMLGLAIVGMNSILSSSFGQDGIWTIRFELFLNETFSYDSSSIDLSNKDQDMFIPNSIDQEGRYEIIIEADEE